MQNKYDEITRSYTRALRDGFPILLNAPGIQYYLDALKELRDQNFALKREFFEIEVALRAAEPLPLMMDQD